MIDKDSEPPYYLIRVPPSSQPLLVVLLLEVQQAQLRERPHWELVLSRGL